MSALAITHVRTMIVDRARGVSYTTPSAGQNLSEAPKWS